MFRLRCPRVRGASSMAASWRATAAGSYSYLTRQCSVSATATATATARRNYSTTKTKVGFVGAGHASFGGGEGPWNHSLRLECVADDSAGAAKDGVAVDVDVEVVGIADIDTTRANRVLREKLADSEDANKNGIYSNCKIYDNYLEMLDDNDMALNAIIIACPPHMRGSLQREQCDMELQCIQRGIDVLVEKPLSADAACHLNRYARQLEDTRCRTKSRRSQTRSPIISVGYMFRYHPGLDAIREILSSHFCSNSDWQANIMHVNLRYQCAYPFIITDFWWDINKSGGPIVEQATHFVDIARYLTGDIAGTADADADADAADADVDDMDDDEGQRQRRQMQILANSIYSESEPLHTTGLSMMDPIVLSQRIPVEQRNQTMTCAQWKSERGAIVSLSHCVHLHHKRFESYIDVWCDGISLRLVNLYDATSKLYVRKSTQIKDEPCTEYELEFDSVRNAEHDPYNQEMKCFLQSISADGGDGDGDAQQLIRSDYSDAAKTYQLTCDIQQASRRRQTTRKAKPFH